MVWIWEVAYAARLSVDIAGAFVVVVGGGVDVAAVDAAAAGVDDVVDDVDDVDDVVDSHLRPKDGIV